MKNHQTNGEDWKPTEDWIFIHRQLQKFLACINEMNEGHYENQPTNSIIPTTENILDYFNNLLSRSQTEMIKKIRDKIKLKKCEECGKTNCVATFEYNLAIKDVLSLLQEESKKCNQKIV